MSDDPRTETHRSAGATRTPRTRSGRSLVSLLGAASAVLLLAACSSGEDATEPPDVPLSDVDDRVQPPAGNTIPTFVAPESASPPDPADAVPAPGVIGDPAPSGTAPIATPTPAASDAATGTDT